VGVRWGNLRAARPSPRAPILVAPFQLDQLLAFASAKALDCAVLDRIVLSDLNFETEQTLENDNQAQGGQGGMRTESATMREPSKG
jgi:hypothetical protein